MIRICKHGFVYRRKLLLAGTTSLAVAVAGCSNSSGTEDDGPGDDQNGDGTDEETDTVSEPDLDNSPDTFPGFDEDEFEAAFDDLDLEFGGLNRTNSAFSLDYTSPSSGDNAISTELEDVAVLLAEWVVEPTTFAETFDLIDGLIDANDGSVYGYEIEVDWIIDYLNDAIDDDEYRSLVSDTIEQF